MKINFQFRQSPRQTQKINIDVGLVSWSSCGILAIVYLTAVVQFSPNGQYLAVGRQSENVIELWNLEDGKITHRFPHSPGDLKSLHFSPTSDCLMAVFSRSDQKCLWRLDTRQMVSFDLAFDLFSDGFPAVIHLPYTNHIFVPRRDTVEIWEVSMTGSNMIFKT